MHRLVAAAGAARAQWTAPQTLTPGSFGVPELGIDAEDTVTAAWVERGRRRGRSSPASSDDGGVVASVNKTVGATSTIANGSWQVIDRCDGSLTEVAKGTAKVFAARREARP